MKTINIHGKEYVEVNERIKHFREFYKDWSLTSEIERLEAILINEKEHIMCVFKSCVYSPDGLLKSTGHAYEILGSTYINKTSFIENCETSANGRALGNLGIGIDTSVASADEVNLAILQHEKKEKPKLDKQKMQAMLDAIAEGKFDVVKKRMNNYKLTKKQKTELDKHIKEQIEEINNTVKQEKDLDKRVAELSIDKAFREYNNLD